MSLQTQLNSFVLRVAEEFNTVKGRTGTLTALTTTDKSSLVAAINELKARASLYDPEILTATLTLVQREMEPGEACTLPARDISINELKEGHVLAGHVMTVTGKLVLFPGTRLSAGHIQLLQNLAELLDLREPIQIHDERS